MLGHTVTYNAWGHTINGATERTLADGYRLVFSGMRGDQQYIKKALAFSSSWVSDRMCYSCEAGVVWGSRRFLVPKKIHARNRQPFTLDP